jgi:hypothetical protein
MEVTKENVHDGKILKELIHNVSNNNNIQKVLADVVCVGWSNLHFRLSIKRTFGEYIYPL